MNKRAISLIVSLAMAMPAYAAWYRDRDNSMVDANDEVGDAMAVVLGGNGTVTQAIQVCAGVYLATAHGAMDNPVRARELDRPYGMPGKFGMRVIAYRPFHRSIHLNNWSEFPRPPLMSLRLGQGAPQAVW